MAQPVTIPVEMTIGEMILAAGWWTEGEPAWRALPLMQREQIAFERTGCKFAYPTWERPVNCLHLPCRIARGELPKSRRRIASSAPKCAPAG